MAINYEDIVQDALRSVVKTVLKGVRQNGLTGNHHLYITFQTAYPGVEIADYLKDLHPEEVTVVLQYQFWDLEVEDDHFSVDLSFNDIREHLVVPYQAITGFVDPSVKFGLQFNPKELDDPGFASRDSGAGKKTKSSSGGKVEDGKKSEKSGRVVSLDAFRKKK